MIREFAPAKVNLFLDVIAKRADGYHDLGTQFQTLDFGDELFGEVRSDGAVTIAYAEDPGYSLEQDLVYKAAALLQKTCGVKLGAAFKMQKRLPQGAGLGGGSSDAAAALRLLNKLWQLGLAMEELEKLGAKLGADVPFLVRGGSAFAEGIGDLLESVDFCSSDFVLVATPKCFVSTKEAYAGISPSGAARWQIFKQSYKASTLAPFNKFEESVFPKYPEIAALKKRLLALGANSSAMCGSGASVFATFESESQAQTALCEVSASVRFGKVGKFRTERFGLG